MLVGGRYFDKYERRDGAWKFLHRAIVTDWANVCLLYTSPSPRD